MKRNYVEGSGRVLIYGTSLEGLRKTRKDLDQDNLYLGLVQASSALGRCDLPCSGTFIPEKGGSVSTEKEVG
jgi:hypothetical protein